jgi:hypothetical protein
MNFDLSFLPIQSKGAISLNAQADNEAFINKVGSKAIIEWFETKYPDQYQLIKSELRKRPS